MKAFLSWHYFIVSKQKAKFEKTCKKKAEEICVELATKYEGKIKGLEQELQTNRQNIENLAMEKSILPTNSDSNTSSKILSETESIPNKISIHKKNSKTKLSSSSSSTSNLNQHRSVASNCKESDLYKLSNSELNKNLKYFYGSATNGSNKLFDELTQHNFSNQVI